MPIVSAQTSPPYAPARLLTRLRVGRWAGVLIATAASLWLGWTLAAPNLDLTQRLAMERYGKRAADNVAAWRAMMEEARNLSDEEKLEQVNKFFNRRVLFEDDIVVWKEKDYWATPLEFMGVGAGDCEDFSISKYMTLQMLGVPNKKLRIIYVKARFGGPNSGQSQAHMVMGYYADPAGEPLILDNLISNIRPASMRTDLAPVFAFNNEGLYVAGQTQSSGDPTTRLSRWRELLDRLKAEGL